MTWTVYESPFGPLTLIGDGSRLRGLYFPGRAPSLDEAARDPEAFKYAVEQLEQYFAGDRQSFELPLELAGTAFQQRVGRPAAASLWPDDKLRRLGARAWGERRHRGAGGADRGVGDRADSDPIVVPCHRVIAADGKLMGYLGGLKRKQALLEFEAAGGDPTTLQIRSNRQQLTLL